MTYNSTGKRITSENLAGQVTTTAWDCCHKISETEPDGSTSTWDYDDEGRVIASSRLIPLDMTNVTWLTTCYEYDAIGRQTATWQTNFAAQVGLPATRTSYDQLGRVIARVDQLGNTTTTEYSSDGRTVSVLNPNTAAVVYSRNADGDTLSVTGTAVTPEFHSYGVLPDGTRWAKTVQGETPSSPRFTMRYENLLGQTIREERSGFQGAVLATVHTYDSFGRLVSTSADYEPTVEYTYDTLGNRIATTRIVGRAVSMKPPEWRKTESFSSFVLNDSIIWLTQTNIVSCSDSAIAPLATSSSRQLTGLTAALPSCSRTTDVRGNVEVDEMLVSSSLVISRQTVLYATNKPLSISRYGMDVMDVSVSAVTNTVTYDILGRPIAHTDGRGNTSRTEYNTIGQRTASIDALGNRTSYAYDQFGNLAAVTNPLGNAIVYEYDLRGRKKYEGGATYPVRYTYDIYGNKTTMMTYRNESLGPDSGDVTTWLYDEAANCMTNKVYADGKGPTYSYTPDGKLSRRTWARGIVTDYAYDGWGNLTNTVYSDETPTVSLVYDAMGRQIEAHDAAGITMFLYDDFGSLTNETVVGVAGTNTIIRYWDDFGRSAGYTLNNVRQSTLTYDLATARLATMLANGSDTPFTWNYLAGSDLKSSLEYPNGLTASWQHDANNQLLQVRNATPTSIISQYDYAYDAAGRRAQTTKTGEAFNQCDTVAHRYNDRNELTNVTAAVDASYRYTYQFDGIGNREMSNQRGESSMYTANRLNQYSAIDDFKPEYDDDGNQTLIKTATGVWSVIYNGENRPINWINGLTNIIMVYDRKGRRIGYMENTGYDSIFVSTNAQYRFIYNGFLCVQRLDVALINGVEFAFIWDPSAQEATRPLRIEKTGNCSFFVAHDGNNNVSELVPTIEVTGCIPHYEYAPFGNVTVFCDDGSNSNSHLANSNPFRFSSEYYDVSLGLFLYTYRHYNPHDGRWCSRDPIEESGGIALYSFLKNRSDMLDALGLSGVCCSEFINNVQNDGAGTPDKVFYSYLHLDWVFAEGTHGCKIDIGCELCQDDRARSGQLSFDGGYAQYYVKFNWRHPHRYDKGVHVRICTDDSGRTFGDLRKTAAILRHELIHANDHCRKLAAFKCGEFTMAALKAGKFDDSICTEIHAYAQMNKNTNVADLGKDEVVSKATQSVLDGCEISKAKYVEGNFAEEFEKRAAQMYDKCKNWEAR